MSREFASDFGVHANVIQRPGYHGHQDGSRFSATRLAAEIVPLNARDHPDYQSYGDNYRPNAHGNPRQLRFCHTAGALRTRNAINYHSPGISNICGSAAALAAQRSGAVVSGCAGR